jgi:hypothetical protein
MPSPYQEFVKRARERFDAREKRKSLGGGKYRFTEHARFKMKQYGVSESRVLRVLRAPRRTEEGIAPRTAAMMQPSSTRRGKDGEETWSQEIWVMVVKGKMNDQNEKFPGGISEGRQVRIVSVWRYPGVSPKRNPIPEDILRELADGSTMEPEGEAIF